MDMNPSPKRAHSPVLEATSLPAIPPSSDLQHGLDTEKLAKSGVVEHSYAIDPNTSAPVVVSASLYHYRVEGNNLVSAASTLVRVQLYLPSVDSVEDSELDSPVRRAKKPISSNKEVEVVQLLTAGWRIVLNCRKKNRSPISNLVYDTVTDGSASLMSREGQKHLLVYNESGRYDLLAVSTESAGSCSADFVVISSELLCIGPDILCSKISRPLIASLSGQRAGKFRVVDMLLSVACDVAVSYDRGGSGSVQETSEGVLNVW
jgi:hypothetical protein